MPDRSVKDAQILAHVMKYSKVIVWTADLNYDLMTVKGSLSSLDSDIQSIELDLKSLLKNELEQLSQIDKDNPIMLKHQLNSLQVETNITVLCDSYNQKIGIIGITNQNNTSQSDSTAIQKRQARALNDFLEAASHDLRTPLSVLNTSLYLLENSKDEVKRNERMQLLKETINRLQVILDNMFLMARIDAMPSYVSNPIQVGIVLHNIVTECNVIARTKNVKLELQPFDILPPIQGHETQLQTAITNIVENAIQNTESGGLITICIATKKDKVIIKVADNGKGISQNDLPHVFERFYRVDKFRPTEETRIGLGLSIANTVIEKHNGQITIDSELGKGTTVSITLPT